VICGGNEERGAMRMRRREFVGAALSAGVGAAAVGVGAAEMGWPVGAAATKTKGGGEIRRLHVRDLDTLGHHALRRGRAVAHPHPELGTPPALPSAAAPTFS